MSLIRFTCRGKLGEEDAGSKAGRRAGLFVPARGGKLARVFILLGDESIMALDIQNAHTKDQDFFLVVYIPRPVRDRVGGLILEDCVDFCMNYCTRRLTITWNCM